MFVAKKRVFQIASSLVITLPPIWLRKNGVKKGDYVQIVIRERDLKIIPLKQQTGTGRG